MSPTSRWRGCVPRIRVVGPWFAQERGSHTGEMSIAVAPKLFAVLPTAPGRAASDAASRREHREATQRTGDALMAAIEQLLGEQKGVPMQAAAS
jgi:hypothetical protein